MEKYKEKKIIVFDLDGTLTKSKGDVDSEMSNLFGELLKTKKVVVMSGASYLQMKKSLLLKLDCDRSLFSNLFLFPTDATSFYEYVNEEWRNIYRKELSLEKRETIIMALQESLDEVGYQKPDIIYGEIIEDRGTQITFSGSGQKAPLAEKLKWDPDRVLREKIIKAFESRISDFDAKVGGSTSIDINKKGVDKSYGIKQIEKKFNISIDEVLFIGDSLFKEGNDYSVVSTGVDTIAVKNPEETKKYIKEIISEKYKLYCCNVNNNKTGMLGAFLFYS